LYLKWFLLLIQIYKMVSKLIYKLPTKVLVTNILYSKLVSFSLLETNLESKILVTKILITNG